MFRNLPLLAIQEVLDSSSGVTPCITMKNDVVPYHQVSSITPERRTKVVIQERAVVVSVCRLPWRYSVVQNYPIEMTEAFTAGVVIFIKQFRARWPWSIGLLES